MCENRKAPSLVDDFRDIQRAVLHDCRDITELARPKTQRTKQGFNVSLALLGIKQRNQMYA